MTQMILAHSLADLGLPLKLTAVNAIEGTDGRVAVGDVLEFVGFDAAPNEPMDCAAIGYVQAADGSYNTYRILMVDDEDYVLNVHAMETVAFVLSGKAFAGIQDAINSNRLRAEMHRQLVGFADLLADTNSQVSIDHKFYKFKKRYQDFGDIEAAVPPVFMKLKEIMSPVDQYDGVVFSRPDILVSHVQPNGVLLRMALEIYRLEEIEMPNEYRFTAEAPAGSSRFSLHITSDT